MSRGDVLEVAWLLNPEDFLRGSAEVSLEAVWDHFDAEQGRGRAHDPLA